METKTLIQQVYRAIPGNPALALAAAILGYLVMSPRVLLSELFGHITGNTLIKTAVLILGFSRFFSERGI